MNKVKIIYSYLLRSSLVILLGSGLMVKILNPQSIRWGEVGVFPLSIYMIVDQLRLIYLRLDKKEGYTKLMLLRFINLVVMLGFTASYAFIGIKQANVFKWFSLYPLLLGLLELDFILFARKRNKRKLVASINQDIEDFGEKN